MKRIIAQACVGLSPWLLLVACQQAPQEDRAALENLGGLPGVVTGVAGDDCERATLCDWALAHETVVYGTISAMRALFDAPYSSSAGGEVGPEQCRGVDPTLEIDVEVDRALGAEVPARITVLIPFVQWQSWHPRPDRDAPNGTLEWVDHPLAWVRDANSTAPEVGQPIGMPVTRIVDGDQAQPSRFAGMYTVAGYFLFGVQRDATGASVVAFQPIAFPKDTPEYNCARRPYDYVTTDVEGLFEKLATCTTSVEAQRVRSRIAERNPEFFLEPHCQPLDAGSAPPPCAEDSQCVPPDLCDLSRHVCVAP